MMAPTADSLLLSCSAKFWSVFVSTALTVGAKGLFHFHTCADCGAYDRIVGWTPPPAVVNVPGKPLRVRGRRRVVQVSG
jgi:hypothetical protein